ncbi:MAG TPA: alkylphosphonate utilization protein [Desulfobacteraceae bacterium]|nr:alkylphosphonate utilization protein [Desulfobacteraceae bacterium]|tara:strand:- start:1139 stop:1489 length:351 start_codon:yes stop_codon:yes gene_type:complete
MSVEENSCPKCSSPYAYPDGFLWICPECSHEWSPDQASDALPEEAPQFLDANGTPLQDGDTVTTIKDLKAGKDTMKLGTKVKNIKLLDDPVNGHDISCKIPGFGAMYLKCAVVKKA